MAQNIIVSDPEVMGGVPCYRGTRVPFQNLIDYLQGGETVDDFARQFPTVGPEMVVQALKEAEDSLSARFARR
jgi:uncharacterized protein (DUF433 family)